MDHGETSQVFCQNGKRPNKQKVNLNAGKGFVGTAAADEKHFRHDFHNVVADCFGGNWRILIGGSQGHVQNGGQEQRKDDLEESDQWVDEDVKDACVEPVNFETEKKMIISKSM